MHPFLLIPLLTLVCSCIVGSGSLARDRDYRPNRIVALAMACTGAWALIEIVYSVQTEAEVALRWVRLLGFVYLPLAPIVLELLARLGRLDAEAWQRARRPIAGTVALLALAHATTPWFVDAVHPAAGGWRYSFGPAFWPGLLLTVGGCGAAAIRMIRSPVAGVGTQDTRALGRILFLPILAACVTDVGFPALGIDGPRLGAATIVLSAGMLWLGFFAAGSPDPASGTLAREFLDELNDGVAILRIDGTLRAANERFARILSREREALIGTPFTEWLGEDEPAHRRLLELEVDTPDGPVPVTLWQSDILDRQGSPIGRVCVLRDQRTLVELRRRLVTAGQMSALGELAAGIAHEVNNPIAWILANLNQLRRQCDDFAKEPEPGVLAELADAGPEIDTCIGALGRVVEFVAEVRSFAYPGGGSLVLYQVEELIEGALRLAAPLLREGHAVSFERTSPPELRCLPQELKHALLSVLLTVGQELRRPGRIRIATGASEGEVHVDFETDAPLGDAALLDGAALLLARGEATRGGGLLIPAHLVRQQGGRLEVGPSEAGGTRLRISLPRGDAHAVSGDAAGAAALSEAPA